MSNSKKSKKASPMKNDTQLKDLSSRKINLHQIELTKPDEEFEGKAVLNKEKQLEPGQSICPFCSYRGKMNQQLRMGCVSWSWVACLLLFTFVLFPLPYFFQSCKDKIVYCPMCGEAIDKEFARCL